MTVGRPGAVTQPQENSKAMAEDGASDMARARSRSQSPSLVIVQHSRSIRCNTCSLPRENNHKLRAHIYLTFHQPWDQISFRFRSGTIQLQGNVFMLGAIGSAVKYGKSVRTPPGVLVRQHSGGVRTVHFNFPESQCIMLSASCLLSMPGRFIPKAILFGPAN